MPICNLFEIVHNIWLQQYGKRGGCVYPTTSNDYVHTFRQCAFYMVYLNGGSYEKGRDKGGLQLQRKNQSNDIS
jgi:hypothetical protein